jgi:DNA-binding NarL/FixJ family response regulator
MTRILVIEDETPIRENVIEMLTFESFEVLGAENGLDGIQQARENLPDLIICDIMMPELDGFEVLRDLRGDSTTATIPFIFLTAKADREDVRFGMDLGADDYLTKPFTNAELLAAINARLARKDTIEKQRWQNLSQRLLVLHETERLQLAQELQDEAGQILAALTMTIGAARGDANAARLGEAQDLLNQLAARLRDLSVDLRPAVLDDLGLLPALLQYFKRFTAQTQVRVDFRHAGLNRRFGSDAETTAFRVLQDALSNIARHTSVGEALVQAWTDRDTLHLRIEDRGQGFDLESTLTGGQAAGLTRMYGRAAVLNGQLSIESAPGTGTRVSLTLPLAAPEEDPDRAAPRRAEQPSRITPAAYKAGERYAQMGSLTPARPSASATTIALADGHDLIRQGMRHLLEAETEFAIVGEADNGRRAIDLVERQRPDVLIIDFVLPGLNGLDVTRHVTRHFPQTRVLILSMRAEEAYVLEALRSGATGYALKQSGIDDLAQAVREVAAGRRYLSPTLSERAIEAYVSLSQTQDDSLDTYGPLTSREREVLQLVAEGHKNAEIAAQLGISPRTAETHRANIMRKLGLRNQAEMIRYALQQGIISAE